MAAPGDYLKLAGDKKALKALSSNSAGNDTVVFSVKLTKINRKGKNQNRVLLITSRHIFNLMPENYSKCNRCMQIAQLHHVSFSAPGQEFVILMTDEYDYRFRTPIFMQAVESLKSAYQNVTGNVLPITEIADVDALKQQVMTKAAVKNLGASWGQSPASIKEPREGGSPAAGPAAAALGADVAASSKTAADDVDSEEDADGEGEDKVGELVSSKAAIGAFAKKSKYCVDDFQIIRVLGKGAFGKVMLVKAKDSQTIYAMKSLSKQQLLEKNEVVHTQTERKALESTHHPFLVHLRYAFQSPAKLYLVMDYCNGGELFYHLKQSGRFPEERAKLYAAEICSAIHHLHTLKIIYRDLKPENVLLDSEGHIRITDFGLAKDAMELGDETHTFCGTPDYLAPEIIKGAGHGRGVDWWSLGTMIYEMLGGLPPFYSENFNLMYERILHAPLEFNPAQVFTASSRSLIEGMLQKDPAVRLGSSDKDGEEIRSHPWFSSIDWKKLEARELKPMFVPAVASATDTSNFDEEFTSLGLAESVVPESALAGKATNFDGFTFVDKGALG